mgnify:FL=1
MVCVVISVGTNIDRENNLKAALAALRHTYGALRMSPVFSNPAVGFTGPEFYNLVVSFETTQTVTEVTTFLHGVEANQGRTRQGDRLDSRELDLDLLLYGDHVLHGEGIDVPRGEILEHPYVLMPLSWLLPDDRHPVTQERYAAMWTRMRKTSTVLLQEINLDLS